MENNIYTSMRTDLAKAKNIGSAKNGVHHWWYQRLSAMLLIPLTIWLTIFLKYTKDLNVEEIRLLLKELYNLAPAILLTVTSFYHAMLGMQVIIEDYIHSLKMRYILLIFMKLFTSITIVSALISMFSFITQS